MKNYYMSGKVTFLLLSAGIMLGMFGYPAVAGNLDMVEENIKELDKLNKEVVRQIPDLPESGIVDLKAKVFFRDGVPLLDTYDKTITTERDQEIHFNQGYTVDKTITTERDQEIYFNQEYTVDKTITTERDQEIHFNQGYTVNLEKGDKNKK